MKTLITFLALVFVSLLTAQTKYENAMEKAFTAMDSVKTAEDFLTVSQSFDRIAKVEKDNWLPRYYSMLSKTFYAFSQEPKEALKTVDEISVMYDSLQQLSHDESELKTLKGLFLTVKVAKDPMTYGQSLSPVIIQSYNEAIASNPNNPRPVYLLAQYQMGGAKFWGKNPKDYCPDIEKSMTLFEAEQPEKYYPNWGKDQAMGIKNTTCSE